MQDFDLSGKVAIVTGASRGLGQYFGRALTGYPSSGPVHPTISTAL